MKMYVNLPGNLGFERIPTVTKGLNYFYDLLLYGIVLYSWIMRVYLMWRECNALQVEARRSTACLYMLFSPPKKSALIFNRFFHGFVFPFFLPPSFLRQFLSRGAISNEPFLLFTTSLPWITLGWKNLRLIFARLSHNNTNTTGRWRFFDKKDSTKEVMHQ